MGVTINTQKRIGELSCGCILGEFLCREAESLWREVNYQYHLCQGFPTTFAGWADYDKAVIHYRKHRSKSNE